MESCRFIFGHPDPRPDNMAMFFRVRLDVENTTARGLVIETELFSIPVDGRKILIARTSASDGLMDRL